MKVVLYILASLLAWLLLIRLFRKAVHFPAPAFIGRFLDSRLRRLLQPSKAIMDRSGFKAGMRVLEIGCGSGAYTLEVAEAVGTTGRVYALDVQPTMLEQLRKKIAAGGSPETRNLELVVASAHQLPFADGCLDSVYMITVLQEIPDPGKVLAECRRVLKAGGTVAVTEWLIDPDYPPKGTTERLLGRAGFAQVHSEGNLWTYTTLGTKGSYEPKPAPAGRASGSLRP